MSAQWIPTMALWLTSQRRWFPIDGRLLRCVIESIALVYLIRAQVLSTLRDVITVPEIISNHLFLHALVSRSPPIQLMFHAFVSHSPSLHLIAHAELSGGLNFLSCSHHTRAHTHTHTHTHTHPSLHLLELFSSPLSHPHPSLSLPLAQLIDACYNPVFIYIRTILNRYKLGWPNQRRQQGMVLGLISSVYIYIRTILNR